MKFVFQYKVGDRVVYTGMNREKHEDIERGETGTIVEISPGSIGVCWDKKVLGRHDCNRNCPKGHGWYVYKGEVMPEI